MEETVKDEVIAALLKQCISLFASLRREAQGKNESFYGTIPKTALVKYCRNTGSERICEEDVLSAWRLEQDVLTTTEPSVIHQIKPVSGMYYPEVLFWFQFDLQRNVAELSFQAGPRYGRGLSYSVGILEDRTVELGAAEVLWVS